MKFNFYSTLLCCALICFFSCKQKTNYAEELKAKQNEVASLITLLSQNPDSTGLRLVVANKMDSVGQYANALSQLDILLSKDSLKYGLWMVKANIFSDSNDVPEAKKCLQKAISLYGGIEALTGLGEIYANEKNDSSLLLAKQLTNLSKPQAAYVSALYYFKLNDANKADSLLNKSMLQDPFFVKNYVLKGKILLQKNQPQNAIDIFKNGLKIEPKNILLLNNIANTFLSMKQTDSAKAYFYKSLDVRVFQPEVSEKLKSL